ncbi:MAG TPA: OmpA family protein [Devosia sp.]|nr:OmpA family protein [Devosia sp.]
MLVIGGEAANGPPRFEVDFDGTSLGQGTVAAAIDTASGGRFADASDKTPYVQTFTFAVPGAVFRPQGDVTVKFLNDDGSAGGHERGLYLASVTLNGRAVTASGLTTRLGSGDTPNRMVGEFLALPGGGAAGVSKAPPGGWPAPVAASATVTGGASAVQVAAVAPVSSGAIAPKPDTDQEPLQTAALDPDPEGGPQSCDLDETYNVIGFNQNSNALTPRLVDRLEQVADDIGGRQCNVVVTGYSSRQGEIASNALFSVERAQNSLRYLEEHGVKFLRASATGVGATDQFGQDFRQNRRVVITVTP